MKNFIKNGAVYTHVAAATISSGDLVQVGDFHGVASTDAQIGDEVELALEGVYELDAEAAAGIVKGDAVYFDSGAVDKDVANKLVGYAHSDQNADDKVLVKLK